jgi:hypothetical protein
VIADAFQDTRRAAQVAREVAYPDRLYRLLSRQIDQACDQVELVNLAGGLDCPADVANYIEQLQRQAGEATDRPRTTVQAHDELFRLSCVLLGRPAGDLEFDVEDDQREAER